MIEYKQELINDVVNYIDSNADDVDATAYGVSKNIETWARIKAPLVERLSVCDDYSADDYAIIKRGLVATLAPNMDTYACYLWRLWDMLDDARFNCTYEFILMYEKLYSVSYKIYKDVRSAYNNEYITEIYKREFIDAICNIETLKNIRVGSNILKAVVLALQAALNTAKDNLKAGASYSFTLILNDVNRYASNSLEALKTRGKKYTLMISANPLDFVSMSQSNYFTSCHNIKDGCYRQGCLSYLNDSTSLIVKVYEDDTPDNVGNIHTTRDFIARIVISLNNDVLLISRCYPLGETQAGLIHSIRVNILKALKLEPVGEVVDVDDLHDLGAEIWSDGAHYRDYNAYNWADNGGIRAYILSEAERLQPLEIGACAYCLECGDVLDEDEEEKLSCCAWVYCEDCGESIRRSEAYNINGCWYCGDCVAWCERCEEYHHRDDVHDFDGETLCADCIRDLL